MDWFKSYELNVSVFFQRSICVCIDKAIEILKEKATQAASIALVTYFSSEYSVAINSSIVIVGIIAI